MATAMTLINTTRSDQTSPHQISLFSDSTGILANSVSTELLSLELLHRLQGIENSYIIKLAGISISCDSTSYDIIILNRDNINMLDSVYAPIKYTDIDKILVDQDFQEFVIRNRSIILSNFLYLYIDNSASDIPTGAITLELIYTTIQNRTFE